MRKLYHPREVLTKAELFDYMLNLGLASRKRRLIITPIRNAYSGVGTIVFSTEGTPPKGYAVYIPDLYEVRFFNAFFEPVAMMYNIRVEV